MNAVEAAAALANAFETRKRDDGSEFVTINDASRDTWIQEAVHAAHGDSLPEDKIYSLCQDVATAINDELEYNEGDFKAMEERLPEMIDGLVPVSTWDLKQWLLNPNASEAVEEVISEGLVDTGRDFSLDKLLMAGYFYQLECIAARFIEAIKAQAEATTAAE